MIAEKLSPVKTKILSKLNLIKEYNINPNLITVLGLFCIVIGSVFIHISLFWASFFVVLAIIGDILDGAIAKIQNKATTYGNFLDSTLDRFGDIILGVSISFLMLWENDMLTFYLAIAATFGSVLVSYIKAKAESLNIECNVGLMERPERAVFTIIAIMTGRFDIIFLVGTPLIYFTIFQRFHHVYKMSNKAPSNE